MSDGVVCDEGEKNDSRTVERKFMNEVMRKTMAMMNVEASDQETIRDVEMMMVLRVSTKHINLWICQLEMKRVEMCQLAGLLKIDEVNKEIEREKSLEQWARRCNNHFTKKTKRMLFEEIDNIVWS